MSKRNQTQRSERSRRRRGMAVVLVLGLVAIAMALSYAMLRTQATAVQIQNNLSQQGDARHAALTGLSLALQNLASANWKGVGSSLSGVLSQQEGYNVEFVAGDPYLQASDEQWPEYPFRVTIRSTGWASDPSEPTRRTQHTVLAVAQLVRKHLAPAPAGWSQAAEQTVHQWGSQRLQLEAPIHIAGPVRAEGGIALCESYPPRLRPFHGAIDEVAIFGAALSSSQLSDLRSGEQSYSDFSSLRHWWRLNDAAGASVAAAAVGGVSGSYQGASSGVGGAPRGGTAAYFNGVDSAIELGAIDPSGLAFTVTAWIRPDSFSTDDGRIISKALGIGESDHDFLLGTIRHGGDHRLRFRLRTNLGGVTTLLGASGKLFTGQWQFVAATYDGWRMRLYLDGVEVGSTSKLGFVISSSNRPTFIGDNPPGSVRRMYLSDLEAMRQAGHADRRPLTGPLRMPAAQFDDDLTNLLDGPLNIPRETTAAPATAPLSLPFTPPTAYRLYPGGPEYQIPAISSLLSHTQFEPDMLTNPLGALRHTGDVRIYDGVTLRGVLLATGASSDVYVYGKDVRLEAAVLPPLAGSAEPIQLPVALVGDDLRFMAGSAATIHGLSIAGGEFEVYGSDDNGRLIVEGGVAARTVLFRPREPWRFASASTWEEWQRQFAWQRSSSSGLPWFPHWLEVHTSLKQEPHVRLETAAGVRRHWSNLSEPLFQPHPDDGALRWELVRWVDSPAL